MTTGLIVGKFAPLHKGHHMLIERALEEMDHVIVVLYPVPQWPQLTMALRTTWLEAIYPKLEVIPAPDVPKDKGYTLDIQMKHVHYIVSLIQGRTIDAFYSSEDYGTLMSEQLACDNRVVDYSRSQIQISGTMIRSDIDGYRDYMHPMVYQDLKALGF